MSLIDKISEISANLSDRVEGQLNAFKQQVFKSPTFTGFFGDSDSSLAKPNSQKDQILNRVALNVAVTNVPGMPLDPASNVDDGDRQFKTIGGVWGRDKQTGKVDFYRGALDPAKTELFDEEFYLPDAQKYPLAANGQYIRLNSKGSLDNSPEFKGRPRPDNISDFDWQGFDLVDASQVPSEYLRGDGNISFENAGLAENQANALKRLVIDNNLVQTWDEGKFQEIFAAKAGTTIKLELTTAGQSNGKTVFSATMSAESLKEFRAAVKEYRAAFEKDALGGVKGQQEATNMATDIPKVFVRATIKTVQDVANTTLEVVDPSIQTDPHNLTRARIGDIMDSQLPPSSNGAREHTLPRVDADPVMPDYNSDLFNRDIFTGKVNKDGITVGKVSETAVELSAPIVAGKIFKPSELSEMIYKPETKGLPTMAKGSGATFKYGDIYYSTRGTQAEQDLAIYHEKVHQVLTPKLLPFREMRLDLKWGAYKKSQFFRYLEETLAEANAQLRVNGVKGLPDAIQFPLKNEEYNIQLSKVVKEGAIGTVSVGGTIYGVYVVTDKVLNPSSSNAEHQK